MFNRLSDKKIAILVTDGFEKLELTIPLKALQAEGAEVEIVSLHSGKIRSMNLHKPANTFKVDKVLSDVKVEDYDGLLIPGGFINPDFLRQSALREILSKRLMNKKNPSQLFATGPGCLFPQGYWGRAH